MASRPKSFLKTQPDDFFLVQNGGKLKLEGVDEIKSGDNRTWAQQRASDLPKLY
jgi:hypothetical protein